MNKINRKKICTFFACIMLFNSCTAFQSFKETVSAPFKDNTPVAIKEAIATRVNPENQIYSVGSASIRQSGALIAQGAANKDAASELKAQVKNEIREIYNERINSADAFTKNAIKNVIGDLSDYAASVLMKKTQQKGAWQDGEKVFSLIVINKSDIENVSNKLLDDFLLRASKNLQDAIRTYKQNNNSVEENTNNINSGTVKREVFSTN